MGVQICGSCEGTGEVRENVGGHHNEYEYRDCDKCNGTGRVKTTNISFSVPFDFDNKLLDEIDTKIRDLIRELHWTCK